MLFRSGSSFPSEKAGGLFEVSTFTKIETTRKLLDTVKTVLALTAQKGITPAEYQKARGYLVGKFAVYMQTPEAMAAELASMTFYGLPDDYLETYLPRLRSVSMAEVNRIARTYFSPTSISTILVGPSSKITPQLQGLGTFETRPVAGIAK